MVLVQGAPVRLAAGLRLQAVQAAAMIWVLVGARVAQRLAATVQMGPIHRAQVTAQAVAAVAGALPQVQQVTAAQAVLGRNGMQLTALAAAAVVAGQDKRAAIRELADRAVCTEAAEVVLGLQARLPVRAATAPKASS